MLFSEWVRREGFRLLDILGGSKISRHYNDIRNIMENGQDPEVLKREEGYLRNILEYATENVEFYKKYKGSDSIQSFPVLTKIIVRENFDAFQSPQFVGARVVVMHTGGSTGIPFVVRQDKNKRDRVNAEMMYFWGKAGYQIGMRYVFFRIWTRMNRKSKVTGWARNMLMRDTKRVDRENLVDIRSTLRSDHKIRMLMGYPNTFEYLAEYLLSCGDTSGMYHIKTIIGIGEALPEITRHKLKEVFNCTVVSLYSNQENGMLAQECVENREFHVNSASYHIELLKLDGDEPASEGEPGRIVVTDLFNHAMPLIRYDTGDIGVWKMTAECGWKSKIFSSIQGRMSDIIFDTSGEKISPHAISVSMWPFDKLIQYQFIQESAKRYILKLNGAGGHYKDAEFVDVLRDFLGQDAEIVIEHVNEIPVMVSGKWKRVMSKYVKSKI